MTAGHAAASGDGFGNRLRGGIGYLAHGPDGHDQVEAVQFGAVFEGAQRIGGSDGESFGFQGPAEPVGHFSGLVPLPAALNDKGFFAHMSFPVHVPPESGWSAEW